MMEIINSITNADILQSGFVSLSIVVLGFLGVRQMKIRKGAKARIDPKIIYKCSECGEYFSAPRVLKQHCEDVHNIILPESVEAECYRDTWEITPEKYQEMLDYEADTMTQQEAKEAESNYLLSAKLAADPKDDPVILPPMEEITQPRQTKEIYSEVMERLETPATSKPMPGKFEISIEGNEIKLMVSATLPNTAANMAAISEFNTKIN